MPVIKARGEDGYTYDVQVSAMDWARFAGYSWWVTRQGYVYRQTSVRVPDLPYPRTVKRWMHREVVGLEPGDPREPDHLDQDPTNNRRGNLEVVTREENRRRVDERRSVAA